MNKIKYYILRYWVSIIYLLLGYYFYEPQHSHHSAMIESKTLFGLGEMTWMWVFMAIAHGANSCYCDIKSLLKK